MTKQVSFTKIENQLRPLFRERLDQAESVEDVKKFFVYTARELLDSALGVMGTTRYEDVSLAPHLAEGYEFSPGFAMRSDFKDAWSESDLSRIMQDFAETACKRYRHLEKNPAKTEAKMYHGQA
ncbi:hypothetical protein dsx2_2981 [Desulfovibrio sp. X2]|uniref:hypothetical protein n=1 Tax=Desulfovibrio sp. X2 TaxID=941449 RepID=UPI000358B273|nr:hypothetical protein [Desulfovibrio sp. X2]EPR41815.1 hypothetical protein dsx2_2981 [Desulfovibrio sp. X2]